MGLFNWKRMEDLPQANASRKTAREGHFTVDPAGRYRALAECAQGLHSWDVSMDEDGNILKICIDCGIEKEGETC